jgi:hypothetical protein
MNPDAYRQILVASTAGGLAGALVMWNRKRSQTAGENTLRRLTVLTVGTAAFACALIAFTKAFGAQSQIYAAMVVIVITGWASVLSSVAPVPVPRFLLRVRAGEVAILRLPWTGVRLFGAFLRSTPLRHLGGRVYLSEVGRNPLTVLGGIHDAQRVHIWALLFCCPWLVFWAMKGWWMSIVWGLAVHVPLNIYPVLHLRYVTGRVEGYMARMRRRKDAEQTDWQRRVRASADNRESLPRRA